MHCHKAMNEIAMLLLQSERETLSLRIIISYHKTVKFKINRHALTSNTNVVLKLLQLNHPKVELHSVKIKAC